MGESSYRDADGFFQLIPRRYSLRKRFRKTDTPEIVLRHGHIAITNYKRHDNQAFEKSLSVWDKISFQYRFVGGYYIKELRELRINRGFQLSRLREFFPDYPFRVENDAYPAENIEVSLYSEPITDFQRVAMTFMAGKGEYGNNKKFTQQMITAPTGSGKSYLGVTASAFLSAKAVVIIPISKLKEQWKTSYTKFTDIMEDEILLVDGSKDCKKILHGEYHHIKVFIIMVDTIVSFVNQYGNMAAMDMFAETGAYIKIVDEIHRDIKAISMIEALCNFRMNYYLSASPGRTEKKENWIFSTLFYSVPKFGAQFETKSEKHINIMMKKYYFTPSSKQINKMVNRKTGMNTLTYEKTLCDDEAGMESFAQALKVMLNWSAGIVAPENKILILAKTISFITAIQEIVEEVFPGETSLYYGNLKPKEKQAALESRVIIATSSSLGTGADIPGVQHCYNCGTYSGEIEAVQTAGRLRKLKNPKHASVYVEFVNTGWKKTVNQYMKRKPALLNRAKGGRIIVVE